MLLEACEHAYEVIINSSDQLRTYQEHFNYLPRAILECSVRDQLLPEADFGLLQNNLRSIKAEAQNLALSLEQRERDCVSLELKVRDLQSSHSWKITAPLRALLDFFRAVVK